MDAIEEPDKTWRNFLTKYLHKFAHPVSWNEISNITDMRTCSRHYPSSNLKSHAVTFSNWEPYWKAFVPGRGVFYCNFMENKRLENYYEGHFISDYARDTEDDWFIQVYNNCKIHRRASPNDLAKLKLSVEEYYSIPFEELQKLRSQAGLKTY